MDTMSWVKNESVIPGCLDLRPPVFSDIRGRLLKNFHEKDFLRLGLAARYPEEYFTRSFKGVIRGMHFQGPPSSHTKIVQCLEGDVIDVVLDLRRCSPAFGKLHCFHLNGEYPRFIYIPEGVAHGFCVLSDMALLFYRVTSLYNAKDDCGILWDSFDMEWPVENPLLSERDRGFCRFINYESPFLFSS